MLKKGMLKYLLSLVGLYVPERAKREKQRQQDLWKSGGLEATFTQDEVSFFISVIYKGINMIIHIDNKC